MMEGIEAVVEAIKDGAKEPAILMFRDKEYTTHRDLYLPPAEPTVKALVVNSLDAVIEYLNAGVDKLDPSKLLVHVVGPSNVNVYAQVENNPEGTRHLWLQASVENIAFRYGSYLDQDSFLTSFLTLFCETEDYNRVLEYVSKISAQEEVTEADDGVAQEIIMQSGINKARTTIKNPMVLKPIRTFTEVDQPESPFVLRMKKEGDRVVTALFEADNGKWKNTARANIGDYLTNGLNGSIEHLVPILA